MPIYHSLKNMTVPHPNAVVFHFSAPFILHTRWEPPPPKGSKVAMVISLLTGRALEWATAIWERGEEELNSYEGFMALFKCIFDQPPEGREGGERLLQLWQGDQTAAEYALTCRTVAASNGWNYPALRTLFRRGLLEEVQTELAYRDDNLTLDTLIAIAIHLDNLLQ